MDEYNFLLLPYGCGLFILMSVCCNKTLLHVERAFGGRSEPSRKKANKSMADHVMCTYNLLAAGRNEDEPSIFEEPLRDSGIWRFWKNRRGNVTAALQGVAICGVCEVTKHMLRYIVESQPRLKVASFVTKVHAYDGSAILYDSDSFECVQSTSSPIHPGRSHVFVAARLKEIATGSHIWVVMLHLKADSLHASMEHVRVRQSEAVLRFVRALIPPDSIRSHPVVVLGDLNTDEMCARDGTLSRFRSVGFKHAGTNQPTYKHFFHATFDYILCRNFHVLQSWVPDSHTLCPNDRQGSDHLPVYATFRL